VVIVQDNRFSELLSVTICPFTTNPTSAPLVRVPIAPTESNGLAASYNLMVDKIMTVPKTKVGTRIGRLEDADLIRLNRAIVVFLGLAGASAED
jgi:mRNA interferase MazF